MVEQGRNIAPREHPWSTMVRMASCPSLLGSPVIRSITVGERFGVNDGRDTEEWGFDAVHQVFVLLTGGTSFDIFGDPHPGTWPEVFLVYMPDCFVSSRVAIKGAIVPCVHNFTFQALVRRDNEVVCSCVSPKW
jgi:hypothetical protein